MSLLLEPAEVCSGNFAVIDVSEMVSTLLSAVLVVRPDAYEQTEAPFQPAAFCILLGGRNGSRLQAPRRYFLRVLDGGCHCQLSAASCAGVPECRTHLSEKLAALASGNPQLEVLTCNPF